MVILIDSVYRRDENYYPLVFLVECKYTEKEKEMSNYITDNKNISSDDSDDSESSEKILTILMKKILMNKWYTR